MPHALSISVPDEVFAHLSEIAVQRGETPEALAEEIVSQSVRELDTDPLLRWLGAFESGVADAAECHDEYLGRALLDEMRGDPRT
jgi:predicted transcriptional regulator